MILDHAGKPWRLQEAAYVRDLLHRYGTTRIELIEHGDGYALAPASGAGDLQPKTDPADEQDRQTYESLRLRPAARAYPGALVSVFLGGVAIALAPHGVSFAGRLPEPVLRVAAMQVEPLGVALAPLLLVAAGGVLVLRGIGQLLLGVYYYQYELGPDRIQVETGIFPLPRHRRSLDYRHARIPTLEQGVIDRLLRVGSVRVSSAGSGDAGDVTLDRIKNPRGVLDEVQRRIDGATRGA
ncbi:PH domain-containing protein [Halorhodospira halophila]|uniref:PH domain-containing protein n=1 Tax=Halorhodospira halophila TaxID=1053 RepID=UPI0019125160|nr:PH domain-containing protein [Halorhodospira halophila]MBK5944819.1 hypothetical protein [Halorhodospira halophila]